MKLSLPPLLLGLCIALAVAGPARWLDRRARQAGHARFADGLIPNSIAAIRVVCADWYDAVVISMEPAIDVTASEIAQIADGL